MDDLTYSLRQLCRRNRDGSHATQADRQGVLTLASRQLREAGFRQMRATSLKGKHVEALLERWQTEGLSAGTLKNRLAHLRWWAEKVGRAGVIPADNAKLGIPERRFVADENKARELGDGLARVRDPHVRMSLALQQAFGLRREESIKFQPRYADRGDCIVLKSSWTKGGRPRTVPITTPEQRTALDAAHRFSGAGSLIPAEKTYIQQRGAYDGQCKAASLSHMHGLRHRYAQTRYEALTGWKAPLAGGPSVQSLTPAQRIQDLMARQTISRELGHELPRDHDDLPRSIDGRRPRVGCVLSGGYPLFPCRAAIKSVTAAIRLSMARGCIWEGKSRYPPGVVSIARIAAARA